MLIITSNIYWAVGKTLHILSELILINTLRYSLNIHILAHMLVSFILYPQMYNYLVKTFKNNAQRFSVYYTFLLFIFLVVISMKVEINNLFKHIMSIIGNTEETLDLVLTFRSLILFYSFIVQCGHLFKYYEDDSITWLNYLHFNFWECLEYFLIIMLSVISKNNDNHFLIN